MDEKTVSFEEKLTGLLSLAAKKKNVLESREILDYFKGEILSPDKLDKIYDFLESHQIDVLRTDDEDIDPDLFLEEGMDGEEEIDRSDPSGFGLFNVAQRLSLNYGSEYGISVDSVFGKGTRVTVVIPAVRE